MNARDMKRAGWVEFLYQAGLESRRMRKPGAPAERDRLRKACMNAEKLAELIDEERRMVRMLLNDTAFSRDWDQLIHLKGKISVALQKFVGDANRYGWPESAAADFCMKGFPKEMLVELTDMPAFLDISNVPVYPKSNKPQGGGK